MRLKLMAGQVTIYREYKNEIISVGALPCNTVAESVMHLNNYIRDNDPFQMAMVKVLVPQFGQLMQVRMLGVSNE